MKLASLKGPGRDGTLLVVSRDLAAAVAAPHIAATLQMALEDWDHVAPELAALAGALDNGNARDVIDFRHALAAGRSRRAAAARLRVARRLRVPLARGARAPCAQRHGVRRATTAIRSCTRAARAA